MRRTLLGAMPKFRESEANENEETIQVSIAEKEATSHFFYVLRIGTDSSKSFILTNGPQDKMFLVKK